MKIDFPFWFSIILVMKIQSGFALSVQFLLIRIGSEDAVFDFPLRVCFLYHDYDAGMRLVEIIS